MIRRWEMAFWAMLAGTTATASCDLSAPAYGVLVDAPPDFYLDTGQEDTGSSDSDVPDDPYNDDPEEDDAEEGEDGG